MFTQDGLGVRVLLHRPLHRLHTHPQGNPPAGGRTRGSRTPARHPHSTMAPMTLRWTFLGRMIFSPPLCPPSGSCSAPADVVPAPPSGRRGLRRRPGAAQHLRLPDHRDGMAEVVQGLHGVDVHGHAPLPQEPGELRVAPGLSCGRGTSKGTTLIFPNFSSAS